MKVKEIIRQVQDPKLYIEVIEEKSGASFGFETKTTIFYKENLMNATIKSINANYCNGKRYIILEVKF